MICGNRIRLRAFERQGLSKFFGWFNDSKVIAGLARYRPLSMQDEEDWFSKHRNLHPAERSRVVERKDGDERRLIGNRTFRTIDRQGHSGEIGLAIGGGSVWGQGTG
ncbi:MAG: GNAT family N-acetyltransferase [Anaerolineales bacterium]|nr:GNAT family N-acetyltransferase [Anaerolineales bacterium]